MVNLVLPPNTMEILQCMGSRVIGKLKRIYKKKKHLQANDDTESILMISRKYTLQYCC